jgi:class 3 adenylate cyclase/tetratricopeptide (TPR) repeat protein
VTEERRLVTVLFADVTGSTALGEALDPEDVRALLARFFEIARDAVESHGGTVEKFIGDAVMAVFGLPQAHGDDAERALSAALELRDRVRADPQLDERLPIRLGVNTGEVIATREGLAGGPAAQSGGSLITGDAVNVAARLQQAAGSWGILCSERTVRAVASVFSFGPATDVDAKGKSSPVRARELNGRLARVHRRVPIVGRDGDLAQLELIARRAFSERRPYLVSIVAPAGTGKTRLIEEFLDGPPSGGPPVTVAISQCLPYGQRLTYWPLRAVLHRLAGVDEDAPSDAVRRAIVGWLAENGAQDPARVGELLAATIGAGEAEATDQSALFAAWRTAVELAAARSPLVLVFEDLHWSSDSLLDLVEYIIQPRGDLPLMMVVLTRPELLDRRPAWGGGRRNHLSLELDPLPDDAVATLVGHLLESAPQSLVDAVVDRAEGNPFYAGEIVRSIAERLNPAGVDTAEVGRLLATLPDTVQATVLARLDQLPAASRRVLQIGAVFGRAFRAAGVTAIEADLADQVDDAVEQLIARDLIRPSGADGYGFRHILIRDTAYQTLPRAERSRLHASAGRWLEERSADRAESLAELIAYHYREAASLSRVLGQAPDEALRDRAEFWLGRAADSAVAAGALMEATQHLHAALEVTPAERLPDLWLRIAENASDGGTATDAIRTALELAEGQDRPASWRLDALTSLLFWQMRFHGSVAANQRLSEPEMLAIRTSARALFEAADDDRGRAQFLIAEAFVPFWRASTQLPVDHETASAAEAAAREGLALARKIGETALISTALDGLTSLRQDAHDFRSAATLSRERLALAEHLDIREVVDAECMVTWSLCVLGEFDEAQSGAGRALASLQPGQVPSWALHLASWRTYALAALGRWSEALATAERARSLWAEMDRAPAGYARHGFISALMVARSIRDERNEALLGEVLDALSEPYGPNPRNLLIREIRAGQFEAGPDGLLAAIENSSTPAERWLLAATDRGVLWSAPGYVPLLAAARGLQSPLLVAQLLRAEGLSAGDPDQLREARSLAERIGAQPTLARITCELGEMLGDRGLVERGRAMLQALGDLEMLDRYESRA